MSATIQDVFDQESQHLTIDRRFAKSIVQFERRFVNQRQENLEFLGGVLLGTPKFRFFDSDRQSWFDELLEIDDVVLRRQIHGLSEVDPTHKVASDPFNLSVIYIVYRLFITDLKDDERYAAQMSALQLLHYRFLSSLMAHYLPYEPDRRVVEAVYAQLNHRYSLKRAGSWMALIQSRCEDILSQDSIHYKTLRQFQPYKDGIDYLLNDIQGRIREIVKKLIDVFHQVRQSEIRVMKRSTTVELDGELHIRDMVRSDQRYRRYIHQVVRDQPSFIRDDLVQVIESLVYTLSHRHFMAGLRYLSDNAGRDADPRIDEFVDEIIVHALDHLQQNRQDFNRRLDLGMILQRLRSVYMSSRSKNPSLLKIRDLGSQIFSDALETRNTNVISSVRSGCMLYIVLRTLAIDHFT